MMPKRIFGQKLGRKEEHGRKWKRRFGKIEKDGEA
jgi:hypothetical protein